MVPDERGEFRVWCTPCDVSGTFPTIEMAIAARREHLCVGEVPSASWPGWDGAHVVDEDGRPVP